MKTFYLKVLIYLFLLEVFFRLGLWIVKDYKFWQPRYSSLQESIDYIEMASDDNYNVLLLGGSAVSDDLPAKLGIQLEDSLRKLIPNVKVYNIGKPGRTSYDNKLVLELCSDVALKKFKEIYYYESLNDSRYNCIPQEHFKVDYSHAHWYQEIALMKVHPEMNYTLIPYVAHLFWERLKERTGEALFLTDQLDVNPEFMELGAEIKTDKTFRNNLEAILSHFDPLQTQIYLLGYNLFIPEEMYKKENLGFYKEEAFYNAKGPRTTSGAWGYPWNAEKAVSIHNEILNSLSSTNIVYQDMNPILKEIEEAYYFDICHFTVEGGSFFVKHLLELRDSTLFVKRNTLK